MIAGLIVVSTVGWVAYDTGPGGNGELGRVRTPAGLEVVVDQRWNDWLFEPYTVSLYMKRDGGTWGWCYIGHEEDRWRSCVVEYDEARDEVVVSNAGKVRGRLAGATNAFTTFEDNGRMRHTVQAPQEVRNRE